MTFFSNNPRFLGPPTFRKIFHPPFPICRQIGREGGRQAGRQADRQGGRYFQMIISKKILEPKLFNIFCQCTFQLIMCVLEVLQYMNKIFQEPFLGDPVFRSVAIIKSMNNSFETQLKRNSFLRQVVSNRTSKSLKNYSEKRKYENLFCNEYI